MEAKVKQVKVIRDTLPKSVGIKVSGEIKNRDPAVEMIEAGADRIGISFGTKLIGLH